MKLISVLHNILIRREIIYNCNTQCHPDVNGFSFKSRYIEAYILGPAISVKLKGSFDMNLAGFDFLKWCVI